MKHFVFGAFAALLSTSCGKSNFSSQVQKSQANQNAADAETINSDTGGQPSKEETTIPPVVSTPDSSTILPVPPPIADTIIDSTTPPMPIPEKPVIIQKPIEGITNNPNNTHIVFGGNGVYHVGDNQLAYSSCRITVSSYSLHGSSYHFRFTVVEDDTQITVSVGRLCGVDGFYNGIALENDATGQKLVQANLPNLNPYDSAPGLAIVNNAKVNKGSYSIAVYSSFENRSDFDDFVIGNISVVSNKPILGTEISPK